MAVFNRVNGDAQNVNFVGGDVTRNANSKIISTGVAGPLNVYNIEVLGNLAAELGGPNGSGVVGAVETLLKTVSSNASVLAYQTNATTAATAGALGGSLTVLVERSGWTSNAALQTVVRTLGNIGSTGTVTATNALVVDTHFQYVRP
jgi:hypothetical protein